MKTTILGSSQITPNTNPYPSIKVFTALIQPQLVLQFNLILQWQIQFNSPKAPGISGFTAFDYR